MQPGFASSLFNRHPPLRKPKYRALFAGLNCFGVLYFLATVLCAYLTDVLHVMTVYCQQDADCTTNHQYLGSFLLAQILVNFALVRFSAHYDNIRRNKALTHQLPTRAASGWKSCLDCKQMTPPRAHHCSVCRHCVLKRDHHCFLTGVCIGYHNQRYFIILLAYSSLAGCVVLYHFKYYIEHLMGVSVMSLEAYRLFLPVTLVEFALGKCSAHLCLLTLLANMTATNTAVAAGLLLQQAWYTCTGRTGYEVKHKQSQYRESICDNVKSVFGKFGLVLCLLPLPFLAHDSDGYTWKHKYR